jgi:hypothetical protein
MLFRDSVLEQQWLGSGSRDCKGLGRHNFLDTCVNGTSEVSIGIYVKCRLRYSGWLLDSETPHGSYGGLKLQGGFQTQMLRENVYLAPTLGRETKGMLTVGKGPRGLYG